MRAYLNGLGFTDDRLLSLGLLVRREEQEEPRPRFRDRLIFPILDASGRTVGFGGRLLGPGEPKYLNSAESPLFTKGRLLYNLSNARHAIRRDERVILVEGYFDVVRLVEAGLESVVAPMGTALTDAQADLLAKSSKTVFLLYDSDAPGQKASFRAGDALLARGLTVRVVTLPDGDDPDTFVARHGREAMEKLLANSMDVFDRKVQLLERGGWFADLQRKRRALDALLPTIRATTDPITRDLYLARASTAAGVERSVLANELAGESAVGPPGTGRVGRRRVAPRGLPTAQLPESAEHSPRPAGPYRTAFAASTAELALVRVMLLHPEHADRVIEFVARLEDEDSAPAGLAVVDGSDHTVMRDPVYRAIYEALIRHGADASIDVIAESLDETAVGVLQELKAEPGAVLHPVRTVDDAVRRLKARGLEERLGEFDRMTPLATGDEKDTLLREKEALGRELGALGGRGWKSVRRTDE